MRVLKRVTPTVTRDIRYNGILRGAVTPLTTVHLAAALSLHVLMSVAFVIRTATFRMRGDRSNQLRHRRDGV